eukprot:5233670-Amphidinium_carterae.1
MFRNPRSARALLNTTTEAEAYHCLAAAATRGHLHREAAELDWWAQSIATAARADKPHWQPTQRHQTNKENAAPPARNRPIGSAPISKPHGQNTATTEEMPRHARPPLQPINTSTHSMASTDTAQHDPLRQ